jgi:prepilin-type N-terminal cleavage/methylation domain-containing protein
MRQKKQFTLIELMVVIFIMGILVTIAVPMVHNSIEAAKAKVCTTNLMILQGAIEAYGLENEALPASLSQLHEGHFQKAWAHVLEKENAWLVKLAYAVVEFQENGFDSVCFADDTFLRKHLGNNKNYLICPSDEAARKHQKTCSYGLNVLLQNGVSFDKYRELKASGSLEFIIADSDKPFPSAFSDMAGRHRQARFMQPDRLFALYTSGDQRSEVRRYYFSGGEPQK